MTTLADLVFAIKFEVDDRELTDAEKKAKASAEKIDKAWDSVGKSVARAGAAIAAASAAFLLTAERAAAAGAAIDDVTKRAGVGAREHQRLAYALEQSGGSAEGLANSYKFLDKAIVDARKGTGPAAEAFAKLGVNLTKLQATKNVEDRFKLLAEGFGKVDDQALKTDLALQVLGRGGLELLPLFDEGADGIKRLGDELERSGAIMSGPAIEAAAAFDDKIASVKKQISATVNEIGIAFLPAASRMIDNWRQLAVAVGAFGLAVGGLKLVQLPGQLGLASDSMATLALRTWGARAAALGLGVALGTALDTAFGLSDVFAGVTNTRGRRGSVLTGDLSDAERTRVAELQTEIADLDAKDTSGLAFGELKQRMIAERQRELDALVSKGRGRTKARKSALKQLSDTGASETARINQVNLGHATAAINSGRTRLGILGAQVADVGDAIADGILGQVGAGIARVAKQERKKRKGGKGGAGEKAIDTAAFDALAGIDIRTRGAQFGASDLAIKHALEAGATSLKQGDSEGVARRAALSSLGSSVGRDLTATTKDPLLSSIFGENVPDVQLSQLARGADPQVLISTINNTFNFANDFEINGAGDPESVGSAIVEQLQSTLQGAIEASTKTAKVAFAR